MKAIYNQINKDPNINSKKTGCVISPQIKELDYFHKVGNDDS